MARNTRNFGNNKVANFGEVKAMRQEFNNLVLEMDELKAKIAAHTHSGVTAGAGVTGTSFSLTFTATLAAEVL